MSQAPSLALSREGDGTAVHFSPEKDSGLEGVQAARSLEEQSGTVGE